VKARRFWSGIDQRRGDCSIQLGCGWKQYYRMEWRDDFEGGSNQDYGVSPSVSSIRVPHGSVKKATCTFLEFWLAR
jgi:hypothetical protein